MARPEYADGPFLIDLFAGCGGLSLGLEWAGFKPLFVNELNDDALETFLLNREQRFPLLRSKYHCRDVKTLVGEPGLLQCVVEGLRVDAGVDIEEGELDLIAGGPPCQGFSGIGHRRSYSVDRRQLPSNHLYRDMAHLVSRLRPKIFLFENVRGLLSARWTSKGRKGEVWEHVLETFQQACGAHYRIRADVVYAKDYGVPQNRPRVLMVGLRNDLQYEPAPAFNNNARDPFMTAVSVGFLPRPSSENNGPPNLEDLLSDLVDPSYVPGCTRTNTYPRPPESPMQRQLRRMPAGDIAKEGDPITEHEYSNHSSRIVAKFTSMLENDGEIPTEYRTKKFAQRVLPRDWDESGPTITATSLPDDYVHYAQPRILSVREWARLQTFPDWYRFAGKRTTGGARRAGNPREGNFSREVPKYTQIGNAVPVEMARRIGEHFRGILELG